ncbi:hypothetical protein H072_11232 [Dactylellina haptotyla CBS 200.50]|uniref:Uncharacterized protein n=1 Tax=Dactylellina haptotyla (strain CBS 200.50) TaxID=1284197 RepID=S8B8P2_DACHA|nr:hypothetical protein H072_11232 [Dactylellina haptotyla CBS 200.50]
MSDTDTSLPTILLNQWKNPSDILSLLLLIGGEIVQKAIAQLVGLRVPHKRHLHNEQDDNAYFFTLTPVAFSFGWVAYAFNSLMAVFGNGSLMPEPDTNIIVVNTANGYVRENNSWVLGRFFRDYEITLDKGGPKLWPEKAPLATDGQERKVSLRIDILEVRSSIDPPAVDMTWYIGWVVIAVQLGIAAIPWGLWGDWLIFLVTAAGTLFSLLSSSLPQWISEKWAWRRLWKPKTLVLTRGNGNLYAIALVCRPGDPDIEALASARAETKPFTRPMFLVLTVFWMLLLITVSGIQDDRWFLIAVGGIGMLQNMWAASCVRSPSTLGLHLKPYEPRSIIIGYQTDRAVGKPKDEDRMKITGEEFMPEIKENKDISDVMGAIMEAEKVVPGLGASLVPIFFPGNIGYDEGPLYNNREKNFWGIAHATMKWRRKDHAKFIATGGQSHLNGEGKAVV